MTPVALALVLAIDVSGSVNAARYNLQRHGVAEAFRAPSVQQAVWQAGPNGIAVAVVEWSDMRFPVVPWRFVATPEDMMRLAADIDAVSRTSLGPTHIGEAILFSIAYFGECRCEPLRRVIDVSGDGVSNGGRNVTAARDAAVEAGITINGLPILEGGDRNLEQHYRADVIGGFGAFVRVAATWNDFGTAISEKLRLEIAGLDAEPYTLALATATPPSIAGGAFGGASGGGSR